MATKIEEKIQLTEILKRHKNANEIKVLIVQDTWVDGVAVFRGEDLMVSKDNFVALYEHHRAIEYDTAGKEVLQRVKELGPGNELNNLWTEIEEERAKLTR
jgi:hypothetical protein